MRTWTQHSILFALPAPVLSFLLLGLAAPNGCGNCWVGQNAPLLLTSLGLNIAGLILFERGMAQISWQWRTPLRWVWYLVMIPWLLLMSSLFLLL